MGLWAWLDEILKDYTFHVFGQKRAGFATKCVTCISCAQQIDNAHWNFEQLSQLARIQIFGKSELLLERKYLVTLRMQSKAQFLLKSVSNVLSPRL